MDVKLYLYWASLRADMLDIDSTDDAWYQCDGAVKFRRTIIDSILQIRAVGAVQARQSQIL